MGEKTNESSTYYFIFFNRNYFNLSNDNTLSKGER